jgi:transcriptional regulator with XRE-family HTH domain
LRIAAFDDDLWWQQPALRPRPHALALIGRAVLRLRLYLGWSQRHLEYKSKVDQTTISRLERGQQAGLSIRRLASILDALARRRRGFPTAALKGSSVILG